MALKPAHYIRPEARFTDKDGTLNDGEGKVLADTVNNLVERTGGPMFGPVRLPVYAKAALPPASNTGSMIFVTDDVGGSVPAFADGSQWRRVTDRNVIS